MRFVTTDCNDDNDVHYDDGDDNDDNEMYVKILEKILNLMDIRLKFKGDTYVRVLK